MKKLIAILAMLLVCSCDYFRISDEALLEKRVGEYFSHERNESWEKTYEYRLPEYQSAVERDYYIRQMGSDNVGWQLVSFKISKIRQTGTNDADVYMEFVESAPPSFFNFLGITKPSSFMVNSKIRTQWRLKDRQWYVVDAGTRNRLGLNAGLIP